MRAILIALALELGAPPAYRLLAAAQPVVAAPAGPIEHPQPKSPSGSTQPFGTELQALKDKADWRGMETLARSDLATVEAKTGHGSADVASLRHWLGQALYYQGRYTEAVTEFQGSVDVWKATPNPDQDQLATSLSDLGMALNEAGRSPEAEARLREGLDIREKHVGPDEPAVAETLHDLSMAYQSEGRFADSEASLRRALAIEEAHFGVGSPEAAVILTDLGVTLNHEGRYAEAETLLRRALATDEKRPANEQHYLAATLNDLGDVFEDQGRFAEAEPLLRQSLAIRQKIYPPNHPGLALGFNNLADDLRSLGRFQEAEPLYRSALAIEEKTMGPEHPNVAVVLNDLALMLQTEGRDAEAEPLYRRALAIREKTPGPNKFSVATGADNLGLLLDSEGRYAEAETLLENALDIWTQTLGPEHPDVANAELNLAFTKMMLGKSVEAIALNRKSCSIFEHSAGLSSASSAARSKSGSDLSLCSFRLAIFLRAWSRQSDWTDTQATTSEALVSAQKASASTVSEALAQASAKSLASKEGVGDEAAAYEAALVELDRLNGQFAQAAGLPDAQGLQHDLADARAKTEAQIESLANVLKTRAPAYWDYRSPEPLTLAALQASSGDEAKLLKPNEAVVLWMVAPGAFRGLVFAISKTRVAWAQIGLSGDELQGDVDNLRWRIDPESFARAGRQEADRSEPFDRTVAHALYVALLGDPGIQQVISAPDIDTLLIVPSGPLSNLPPGLLVVDPPLGDDADPQALATTHWLIRDKAIAILPGLASLRTLRERLSATRQAPDLKLLAMADPDFAGAGVIPQPPTQDLKTPIVAAAPPTDVRSFENNGRATDALRQLPPLYGTLAEGRSIAQLLDPGDASALLVGPDATKTNLLRKANDGSLARTEVVSFSTHGLLTGDFSGLTEPALALAHPPQTGADPSDDGLLKASDAAALTLNADWVVLSACNTAAGDAKGAEGLSGLARAFFHAGASTLLVSHWRVDDAATEQLITQTFRFRAAGKPKAQALRAASLDMLDEPSHSHVEPRYWAPFVVVGEPE